MNHAIAEISNAIHDTANDKLARLITARHTTELRLNRFNSIIDDMQLLLGMAKTAVRYRNNLPYIKGQLEWVNECLDPAVVEKGGPFVAGRASSLEVPSALLELYKELLATILKTQSMAV